MLMSRYFSLYEPVYDIISGERAVPFKEKVALLTLDPYCVTVPLPSTLAAAAGRISEIWLILYLWPSSYVICRDNITPSLRKLTITSTYTFISFMLRLLWIALATRIIAHGDNFLSCSCEFLFVIVTHLVNIGTGRFVELMGISV